jgi:hypothetical protein
MQRSRNVSRFRFISCITALAACLTAVALVAKEHGTSRPIAITNVRIFDGERIIPDGTVVISGRTIEHVGQKDKIPVDADIIDGAGATLMPGLIDSHAHDWGYGVGRAPIFGVTTELEMFGDAGVARFLDGMEAQNGAPGYASLITAGTMATRTSSRSCSSRSATRRRSTPSIARRFRRSSTPPIGATSSPSRT